MKLLYIDLFCGAGGTSTGVEESGMAKVIACVNHDENAIASHAANHPDALHFTEDIRTLNLDRLKKHITIMRKIYPDAKIVLWASLECTNFSKAKGGQPRDADSRTLAEHLHRYVQEINPDYIQIENVEEFMSWGDLDDNGKPISKRKGTAYHKWVNSICDYGYEFDYRILNAADFGAYTSRKRFFGIFAKEGLPIAFPEQTHSKTLSKSSEPTLFGLKSFKKWKPVKDVLDFSDEGESIFLRKKPLSDKTLERIYAGLIKFVAGGKDKWLLKYNSINGVTGKHIPPSIDEPCPALTTNPKQRLVKPVFIDQQYGQSKPASIENPLGCITANPKYNLVNCHQWVMNTNFGNIGSSIDEPSPVITANRKWHYLMNPQFASAGGSIDNPCFTLIAQMNKMPPYLVATESGIAIQIYEEDTEPMRKIKEFMAIYGIADIKKRMLKIPELKQIMGFPKNYILIGTKAEQKKYIGNAVEVTMAKVMCLSLAKQLKNIQQ